MTVQLYISHLTFKSILLILIWNVENPRTFFCILLDDKMWSFRFMRYMSAFKVIFLRFLLKQYAQVIDSYKFTNIFFSINFCRNIWKTRNLENAILAYIARFLQHTRHTSRYQWLLHQYRLSCRKLCVPLS